MFKYNWPGNIRELKNVIQRAAILSKGKEIDEEILREAIYSKGYAIGADDGGSDGEFGVAAGSGIETTNFLQKNTLDEKKAEVDRAKKALLEEALRLADSNKTKASELLGVTRQTVYRLMEKYSLSDNK